MKTRTYKRKYLSAFTPILAAAALAATALSAHAEQFTPTDGDLFLAVYDSTGAVTSQYYADIGSYTTFLNASSPVTITLNISNDLANTFGPTWQFTSTLKWGVLGGEWDAGDIGSGSTFLARDTVFATQADGNLGLATKTGKTDSTTPGVALINKFVTTGGTGLFQLKAETAVGSQAILAPTLVGVNKQGFYRAETTNNGFWGTTSGYGFQNTSGSNVFTISTDPTGTLDLYEILPNGTGTGQAAAGTAANLLGSFAFNDDGNLVFTPEAVPEPSTYALMLGGLGLLLIAQRHRRLVQLGA